MPGFYSWTMPLLSDFIVDGWKLDFLWKFDVVNWTVRYLKMKWAEAGYVYDAGLTGDFFSEIMFPMYIWVMQLSRST